MSEKLEAWRKRERRQASIDLATLLKQPVAQRVIARLLLKLGTYGPVSNKRDAARRQAGLELERDILRACGEQVWVRLQHIRLNDFAPPQTELVHREGESP